MFTHTSCKENLTRSSQHWQDLRQVHYFYFQSLLDMNFASTLSMYVYVKTFHEKKNYY